MTKPDFCKCEIKNIDPATGHDAADQYLRFRSILNVTSRDYSINKKSEF